MSWQDYLILRFLFLVESTLQRTSSTASVYLPCSINLFFFRFIRKATISFLSFVLKYIWFFSVFILSTSLFYLIWWYIKEKILSNMQKGFCSKQGKSLKNYAIFRFSCKPRGTISSVAKSVARKVPSPETRINTGFFGTSKPKGTTPTRLPLFYSRCFSFIYCDFISHISQFFLW